MVLSRGKYGIEIYAVDSQLREVVKVLRDALYRAAELAARPESAELALGGLKTDVPPRGRKAVREDVVDHRPVDPVRSPGNVRAVVEGELEILRAVVHQLIREHPAVIEAGLPPVRELEVIEDAVVGTFERQFPPVVIFVRECALHGFREPVYGRPAAGGVAIPERDSFKVPPRGAQAKDNSFLVQPVGVFGHGYVQYGFFFHAILSRLPR